MKKILVCDALDADALAELEAVQDFDVTLKTGMDESALMETVPGFHAAVVRSATKITKNVIDAADTLEVIVRAGIGLDNVDVERHGTRESR